MRLYALALGLLPVPVAFAAAAHDGASGSHRRHHARAVQLEQRELAGQGFNDTNAMSMTASDAIATTSSSSSSISSAVSTTSSAISTTSSETSSLTTSTTSSSAVVTSSSSSSVAESSTSSAAAVVVPTSSSSAVSSLSTVSAAGPSTLASVPVVSSFTSIVQVTVSAATTTKAIPSSVVSSSANQDNTDSKSGGGLSKGAIIAIAVVAGVLGLIAIGWTLFRKWKLKPSNRFDDKMRPISFGPHGVADDEFFEKTLQRTASHSSADRQRQAYASELDNPNLVAGIPEHDFTAGGGGVGNTYDAYHQDPYYHAEAYEYNPAQQHAYAPGAYGVGQVYGAAPMHTDYPSQDAPVQEGYADLQRGNSQGSGSGHGHGSAHGHRSAHGHAPHQTFPNDFPSPENYLGRPTGMGDGPYAQAAQYRGL